MSNAFSLSDITLEPAHFAGYVVAEWSTTLRDFHFILNVEALKAAADGVAVSRSLSLADGTDVALYTVTDVDGDVWSLVVLTIEGKTFVTGGTEDFVDHRILSKDSVEAIAYNVPTVNATPAEILATL